MRLNQQQPHNGFVKNSTCVHIDFTVTFNYDTVCTLITESCLKQVAYYSESVNMIPRTVMIVYVHGDNHCVLVSF